MLLSNIIGTHSCVVFYIIGYLFGAWLTMVLLGMASTSSNADESDYLAASLWPIFITVCLFSLLSILAKGVGGYLMDRYIKPHMCDKTKRIYEKIKRIARTIRKYDIIPFHPFEVGNHISNKMGWN